MKVPEELIQTTHVRTMSSKAAETRQGIADISRAGAGLLPRISKTFPNPLNMMVYGSYHTKSFTAVHDSNAQLFSHDL